VDAVHQENISRLGFAPFEMMMRKRFENRKDKYFATNPERHACAQKQRFS